VTIDAGKNQPPAWAYIPQDHGLPTPPPVAGTPLPPTQPPVAAPAGGATPPTIAGHWVCVGVPAPKSGGGSGTAWAFVPEIGPSYGVMTTPPAQPK
jgi:hypothetical protein